VKGNRDFSSIRMMVSLMATFSRPNMESITRKSGDDFSGSYVSQLAIINRHQAVTITLGSEKI